MNAGSGCCRGRIGAPSLMAGWLGLFALTAGCVTAPPPQRVMTLEQARTGSAAVSLEIIDSYPAVLATVVTVLEQELGFPRFEARLEFLPDREAMRRELESEGIPKPMASRLAELLDGVALPGRVLINETTIQRLTWSARMRFLAHELTHVSQNELSGGRRTPSNQWLREGFAEWAAWRVMETVAPGSLAIKRRSAERQVALAHRRGVLPPLAELATAADFFAHTPRHLAPFFYSKSFLAAEQLIEVHGVDTMLEYFSLFARSDNAVANFQIAFGRSQAGFERDFAEYVRALPVPERRPGPPRPR